MKRAVVIALLTLCIFGVAHSRGLVLQLVGGAKAFYPLPSNDASVSLKMTQEGFQVETAQYAFTLIEKFYISETDEASEINLFSTSQPDIVQQGGVLYIIGCDKPLHVYGIDGKEVSLHGRGIVQTIGNTTTVNIHSLPAGTYIIQTGNKKVKLMKQ